MTPQDFTIIIDTREQKPWTFNDHLTCHAKLDTGDYAIKGLEHELCIERKRSVAEIANNITENRFVDVIDRMDKIPLCFLLLEFNLDTVLNYPVGSGIPQRLWSRIRISPQYILKHLLELQMKHNIKVVFCGDAANAEILALAIMNRVYKNSQIPKE